MTNVLATLTALSLAALALPACSITDGIPDDPLPGRDELVAAFGTVTPGTVVLRERDLSSSVTCSFDDVLTEGFDGGAEVRIEAPPSSPGPQEPGGIAVGGRVARSLPLQDQPPVAAGDTLVLSGLAGGCGDKGGDGEVTVYVVGREASRVQAVFAGDFYPDPSGTGIRSNPAFRVLGAFDVEASTDEE